MKNTVIIVTIILQLTVFSCLATINSNHNTSVDKTNIEVAGSIA